MPVTPPPLLLLLPSGGIKVADRILVLSGFLTGGTLALRRGARATGGSAVGGAALLAAVEGVGVGLDRVTVWGVLGGGAGAGAGAAAGGLLKEVVAPENFTFC